MHVSVEQLEAEMENYEDESDASSAESEESSATVSGIQARRRFLGESHVLIFSSLFRLEIFSLFVLTLAHIPYLDDVRLGMMSVRDHAAILMGAHTGAEGAAIPDELIVLMGLDAGISTFVKADDAHLLLERRVLRQASVVFEVRAGSKTRSWARKVARGTHKRQIWLINEELIVTKSDDGSYVHRELCREYIRQLNVVDVSQANQHLLSLEFHSGFVFIAHFATLRELEVWQSLLQPSVSDVFPWGVAFDDGFEERSPPKELFFRASSDAEMLALLEKMTRIEGLVAAQEAALSSATRSDSQNISSRSLKRRQMRIQRAMFGALKEVQQLSLTCSRRMFGEKVSPTGQRRSRSQNRNRSKRYGDVSSAKDDSWSESESEDSSLEDEIDGLDIRLDIGSLDTKKEKQEIVAKPLSSPPRMHPVVGAEVVPPMPNVRPNMLRNSSGSASSSDNDLIIQALKRQLALRDMELHKVRTQLANLVNENWRKNLQVAQLKNGVDLKESLKSVSRREESQVETEEALQALMATASMSVEETRVSSPRLVASPSLRIGQQCFGLPLDLVRLILSQVSVSDIASLMQTSRINHQIVSNDDKLWNRLLMSFIPPKNAVPINVVSVSPLASLQLKALLERFVCAGCGEFLPYGPSNQLVWQILGVPLCNSDDCLERATITADEAKLELLLDSNDLEKLRFLDSPGLYGRRDARLASHDKYGGARGLDLRKRALYKQQQLRTLSRFKRVTTRPVDLIPGME